MSAPEVGDRVVYLSLIGDGFRDGEVVDVSSGKRKVKIKLDVGQAAPLELSGVAVRPLDKLVPGACALAKEP